MEDVMGPTFTGFVPPTENWSKLPHQLINALPLIETIGEMKVILYVLRHTWGFHDDEKRITLDEFCDGRKRRDRSRIDAGTGLSKPTVIEGIERAIKHGFLEVETDERDKGRVKKFYRLSASDVKKSDTTSQEPLQRSEKETIERNLEEEGASAPSAPADDSWPTEPAEQEPPPNPAQERLEHMRAKFGDDPFSVGAHCQEAQEQEGAWTVPRHNGLSPACATFKEATGYAPPKPWRDDIDEHVGTEPDALKRWYDVCHAYVGCGWNPRNAKAMLDYFVVGEIPSTKPEGGSRNGGASTPRHVQQPQRGPTVEEIEAAFKTRGGIYVGAD